MSQSTSGTDEVDNAIDKACRSARRIKRCEQVGSYAWHVTSKRKRFRVQTDAIYYSDAGLEYTFATCDCDGMYTDRTTICPHVIRVLQEISDYEETPDEPELPV